MINPGGSYLSRQQARGNHVTQKCVIEVGNYALASQGASATASSEFSADWPAAAVVNGSLTHINAGAAGVADDGVGGGVWQGNALADADGNVTESIEIDLGQSRRVNRIKLIFWPDSTKNGNLGSIGPKDFLIEQWYSGAYHAWTGLVDKCSEIGKFAGVSYGGGSYGGGSYGGGLDITNGQVTNNPFDMVVFEDPTPQNIQKIRISISKLQSGGVRSRIVAVEVTLAVDVSTFLKSAKRVRQKDYHLQRRTAAELDVTLINHDKRFNDKHSPTVAEIAKGFFSNSIRPHLPIRFFAGFSGLNVQMFSGTIETWNPDSKLRTVDTVSLDFLKSLVKPTITAQGLKTGWSIEALIEYVANLQNFPSNMMSLDTSTVTVGYFMPVAQNIQQILNGLQDATGDSEIYVDEYGRLNFRSYLNLVSHESIWDTQALWNSGTLTNVETSSIVDSFRRKWFLIDDFADGDYSTNPVWTVVENSPGTGGFISAASNYLDIYVTDITGSVGTVATLTVPLVGGTGIKEGSFRWREKCNFNLASGPAKNLCATYYFGPHSSSGASASYLIIYADGSGSLFFSGSGGGTLGFTVSLNAWHEYRVTISGTTAELFIDGVSQGTTTPCTDFANYPTLQAGVNIVGTMNLGNTAEMQLDDIYFSNAIDSTGIVSNAQAVLQSPTFDQGVTAAAELLMHFVASLPTGTSVTLATRTSDNGSSWDAWINLDGQGNILSTARRYIQFRATLGCPTDDGLHNADFIGPTVGRIFFFYQQSAGSARYSGSADWVATDYGLLLGNKRTLTSIVGGQNYVFTQAIVKAKPLILAEAPVTAWHGTNNGDAISSGNPLYLPVGDTVINVDYGSTNYNIPQTVNLTLGTATATTSLTSHPSSPTLTISVTVAGTITGLTISGTPFVSNTIIQATVYASQTVRDNYDENIDTLSSDYIDNEVLAQDVAGSRIARFGHGALDWIKEGLIRFFPGAQINDRVTVTDSFAEINSDYYLLAATDEISLNTSKQFTAKTSVELVKI